jgi:hypothetical protein
LQSQNDRETLQLVRADDVRYEMPQAALAAVEVTMGLAPYGARVANGALRVDGARVPVTWAYPDTRSGALVVSVPPADHVVALAGGAVLAAVLGHPRNARGPGKEIDFIWSDHVALAGGLTLDDAMHVSRVPTKQPKWLHDVAGRIRVETTGDISGLRVARMS